MTNPNRLRHPGPRRKSSLCPCHSLVHPALELRDQSERTRCWGAEGRRFNCACFPKSVVVVRESGTNEKTSAALCFVRGRAPALSKAAPGPLWWPFSVSDHTSQKFPILNRALPREGQWFHLERTTNLSTSEDFASPRPGSDYFHLELGRQLKALRRGHAVLISARDLRLCATDNPVL
jgi:hypothetical protein